MRPICAASRMPRVAHPSAVRVSRRRALLDAASLAVQAQASASSGRRCRRRVRHQLANSPRRTGCGRARRGRRRSRLMANTAQWRGARRDGVELYVLDALDAAGANLPREAHLSTCEACRAQFDSLVRSSIRWPRIVPGHRSTRSAGSRPGRRGSGAGARVRAARRTSAAYGARGDTMARGRGHARCRRRDHDHGGPMFATPIDLPQPVGMAVTVEPDGGVPSPTERNVLDRPVARCAERFSARHNDGPLPKRSHGDAETQQHERPSTMDRRKRPDARGDRPGRFLAL